MNPWESPRLFRVSRGASLSHGGAGDESHGACDQSAGNDRKPWVVANIVVDAVRDVAEPQRCFVVLPRERAGGVGDGVIDTVAKPLDVGIVRVRKLYEQFLRAIDQLVEPAQFVHFYFLSGPVDGNAHRQPTRIVSGATGRRKVLEIEGATATAIAAAFPDPVFKLRS
jgi:hypothetical protein